MNKIELNKTIVGQCNLCEYPIHKSEKVIKKGAFLWHKVCYDELIERGLIDASS